MEKSEGVSAQVGSPCLLAKIIIKSQILLQIWKPGTVDITYICRKGCRLKGFSKFGKTYFNEYSLRLQMKGSEVRKILGKGFQPQSGLFYKLILTSFFSYATNQTFFICSRHYYCLLHFIYICHIWPIQTHNTPIEQNSVQRWPVNIYPYKINLKKPPFQFVSDILLFFSACTQVP